MLQPHDLQSSFAVSIRRPDHLNAGCHRLICEYDRDCPREGHGHVRYHIRQRSSLGPGMPESIDRLTDLLTQASVGNVGAREQLVALVHSELRQLAKAHMRNERPDHTLQATALVNEAYLSLFGAQPYQWPGRHQFFAHASRVMRHILVDHARRKSAQKRGGDRVRVTLDGLAGEQPPDDLIALDEALTALAAVDRRKSELVELRFFGGLSIKDITAVSGLAASTIHKELKAARGWLFHRLEPSRD